MKDYLRSPYRIQEKTVYWLSPILFIVQNAVFTCYSALFYFIPQMCSVLNANNPLRITVDEKSAHPRFQSLKSLAIYNEVYINENYREGQRTGG